MPWFIPALIAGASALGGLLGNRKKTYTQTQEQKSDTNWNNESKIDQYTMPQYDDVTGGLRDRLAALFINRTMSDPDMSGYTTEGLNTINKSAGLREQALKNTLAARGLTYSPNAGYASGLAESSRISDATSFMNSIPLLRDQIQRERISDLSGFFKGLPVGSHAFGTTTSTGTSHTLGTGTGTSTDPGNMLGGLFGGLGSSLAFLYGQGAFGNKPKVPGLSSYSSNSGER